MSSRRRSSKEFSLRQPPIVYTVYNCRLLRKLFSLFSSRPKSKSTTSYPPSSSTTLTTTTAATTTTTDTRDPLSFITNPLNEGRPNRSSTKTGQAAYSPSSSTTLTTTMAATIDHTWDYYGRNNYLNKNRPNYHATRERKPRRKKRICNNGSVMRESAPATFTSADYYGRNKSRPNNHATPMVFTSADPLYDFYKSIVEMITVMEIDTLDDLAVPQT